MASDYISREEALDFLIPSNDLNISAQDKRVIADRFSEFIKSIPAADVRPVVTCEECDWHVDIGFHYCNKLCISCPDNAEFFCAYGERRTE